jgi:hypothetical protein
VQPVVSHRVVPLHLHQTPGPRGAHERQKAPEPEPLLAEVGLPAAQLVLQAAELRRPELGHDVGEQPERVVGRRAGRRERHLGVALRGALTQLDDALVRQVAEQLGEAAEAVIGLVERRIPTQDRPLEPRGEHGPVGVSL